MELDDCSISMKAKTVSTLSSIRHEKRTLAPSLLRLQANAITSPLGLHVARMI